MNFAWVSHWIKPEAEFGTGARTEPFFTAVSKSQTTLADFRPRVPPSPETSSTGGVWVHSSCLWGFAGHQKTAEMCPKWGEWVISKAWITTEHGVDRKLYTGKTSCPLPIIIIIFFKDLTRALGWEKSAALQGWSTQGCRWLKLTSRVFCRRGHIHHLSLQTFLSFLLLSSLWLWITTASTMGTCSLLHLAHPNKIQTRNCCQCGAIYPLALSWGSCWIYLGSVKSRICCRVFGPAQLSRVSVINKLSSVM